MFIKKVIINWICFKKDQQWTELKLVKSINSNNVKTSETGVTYKISDF